MKRALSVRHGSARQRGILQQRRVDVAAAALVVVLGGKTIGWSPSHLSCLAHEEVVVVVAWSPVVRVVRVVHRLEGYPYLSARHELQRHEARFVVLHAEAPFSRLVLDATHLACGEHQAPQLRRGHPSLVLHDNRQQSARFSLVDVHLEGLLDHAGAACIVVHAGPHGLVVAHVALDVDVVGLHHLPGGADEILDLPDEELHRALSAGAEQVAEAEAEEGDVLDA
mmetsp:Transcript_36246/g.107681  ORF Transcript_36246/g.107681 Transcript_36246/m.107681 type:complete len:225 (-) Transcript_36246:611-1285(-)